MTKQEAEKRIKQLRDEIKHHSYLYHVLDKPEISDSAWDSLKRELADLESQFPELVVFDSPTQRVSGKPLDQFKKTRHKIKQWSLNDVFSLEELMLWEERNVKILQKEIASFSVNDLDYTTELKIDGLHIVLTYEKGLLKTAATRGDGVFGEDVTQNIKTILNIPLRLKEQVDIVVEGEIWMSKKEFDYLNQQFIRDGKHLFANPRNAAAGSIRQLDSSITASRKLDSFIYDLVLAETLIDTQYQELQRLLELGFKVENHFAYCNTIKDVIVFLERWEADHDKLDYLVDGVVVKVNKRLYQEILGYTGKAPRFVAAFKFPAEEAATVITDIKVQVGRSGRLTPVAYLRPVFLAGSTVSRATLHNQKYINDLDARVLDTVVVRKAGDIIPEVLKVLERMRPKGAFVFKMPKTCPACGSSVIVESSGESILHFCHNRFCRARNVAHIAHFVSKRAFNIDGVGDKIIARFLDEGLIADPSDIFTLKKGDIEVLEGFGEKSALNLIAAITASKKITLAKFLYSLGIPHIGERMAQSLAKFAEKRGVKTISSLLTVFLKVTLDQLQEIPDFGPKSAESVVQWFQDKRNQDLIKHLSSAQVYLDIQNTTSKLKGQTIVFTGAFLSFSRDEAKDIVIANQGIVRAVVSANIDYVVAGVNPGSKYEKAKKLGVKIIDEKEFLKLVKR